MSEPVQYQFKELEKFQIFTETPGVPGKRSRLGYSSYRGNPRITVFTNVPNDSGKGVINAPMNPETFLVFLDLLEQIARNPAEDKYKIDCWTIIKAPEGAERNTEKTLISELYFGRDKQGVIWMSVVAPNRPRIKFEYRISDFHKIFKGDGSPLNESESSTVQTLATIRALREVMMAHMGDIKPPYTPNGDNSSRKAVTNKVSTANFDDVSF
jgi:hypothetical protein